MYHLCYVSLPLVISCFVLTVLFLRENFSARYCKVLIIRMNQGRHIFFNMSRNRMYLCKFCVVRQLLLLDISTEIIKGLFIEKQGLTWIKCFYDTFINLL